MFGWLFSTTQSPNQHYRDVEVTSSRRGKRTVRVSGDLPVGQIEALRAVSNSLEPAEPGETVEIKTYFD